MNIYLCADTHFFHKKIIEYENRPIDYEEKILKGLQQIPEGSMLIHLGDICIGRDKEAMDYIKKLKLHKTLVRGNHDKKSIDWYLSHGFDFVCDMMWLRVCGKNILFSHAPYVDIGYDVNIHGHCHSKERKIEFEPTMNDKQKLLVIEKTNYQPVRLETFLNNNK